MTRRELIEGILFLPGIALAGAVIFGGMCAIIVFGGWTLKTLYFGLRYGAHLPHSVALALSVIIAAFTVLAVVPRVIGWIGDLINRPK